jgi:PIN domain nuclease of toxin-antitoxin system
LFSFNGADGGWPVSSLIFDITPLELTTLARKARIRLDISLESFLREVEARFIVLPISGRACVRALALPATYPKDHADRIIAATAIVEGMSLRAERLSRFSLRNVQLKSISLFTKCPSLQRIHNSAAFVAPQREPVVAFRGTSPHGKSNA